MRQRATMLTVDHHDLARITNDSRWPLAFLRAIACSDEFCMADDTFALSPISARAARPGEADYEAIREAFMETARGRWFLGEYTKRNRNADTRMVLDAVAKIEETLAAQRQPLVEDRLPEALIEIRRAIREAETIAIAAFDPAAIEASLA